MQLPLHLVGYVSLGKSNDSSDKKNSLNEMFGLTVTRIWKTGFGVDARYSKFDSSFASGTYRTVSVTRDLGERFRLDLQGGRYDYNSSLAATSNSYFVNTMFDMDLGAQDVPGERLHHPAGRYRWITTSSPPALGYRFDNRRTMREGAKAKH